MIQFFPRLRQALLFKYPQKNHHNPLPVSTYILVFHPTENNPDTKHNPRLQSHKLQ